MDSFGVIRGVWERFGRVSIVWEFWTFSNGLERLGDFWSEVETSGVFEKVSDLFGEFWEHLGEF